MHTLLRFTLITACLAGSYAHADGSPNGLHASLHGFGTLGYVSLDESDRAFVRDGTQNGAALRGSPWRRDTRFGLQGNLTINPQWEAMLQVVAREQAIKTVNSAVDWAFVKYVPTPGIELRLGRLALDLSMLADQRNIGYTYDWVRPPMELYGSQSLQKIDGIDLTHRFTLAGSNVRLRAALGKSEDDVPMDTGTLNVRMDHIASVSLGVTQGPWHFNAGIGAGRFATEWLAPASYRALLTAAVPAWPDAARVLDAYRIGGTSLRTASLGLEYDDGLWKVIGELAWVDRSGPRVSQGTRGYLSVGRRFGDFTPFVLLSASRDQRHFDMGAPLLPPAVLALRDFAHTDLNTNRLQQRSIGLGLRWDFAPNMALKTQIDHSHIPADGYQLWWPVGNAPRSGGSKTLATLTYDFTF